MKKSDFSYILNSIFCFIICIAMICFTIYSTKTAWKEVDSTLKFIAFIGYCFIMLIIFLFFVFILYEFFFSYYFCSSQPYVCTNCKRIDYYWIFSSKEHKCKQCNVIQKRIPVSISKWKKLSDFEKDELIKQVFSGE